MHSQRLTYRIFGVIFCIAAIFCWVPAAAVAEESDDKTIPLNPYGVRSLNPYVVEGFTINGKQIERVIFPSPPTPPVGFNRPIATVRQVNIAAGVNMISNVPALTWVFGCSATSAAMLFGHYDNTVFPKMYTGATNDGIFPMTNATWGIAVINGETRDLCPLSATRLGLDGRTSRGHVDDYWVKYSNAGPDPYITNGWAEHVWGDCTGDFMGTNQSGFNNMDGATSFYYDSTGERTENEDFEYLELSRRRDGCYGMYLFAQSRGYTVISNFSQLILGEGTDPSKGFSFEDYKAEIDAGRPVMIHIHGHSMLGYGYDDTSSTVYIHDTWDHSSHTMTWGDTYAGMKHFMVTVIRLHAPSTAVNCPECPADGQIANVTYPAGIECSCSNEENITIGEGVDIPDGAIVNFSAGVSITFSSNLSISSGATAVFTAPLVTFNPGFYAAEGAMIHIKQP